MHLEEIDIVLKQLDKGDYKNAIAILTAERDKLLQLNKQHNKILTQQSFEKYVSEIALHDSPKWSNLYSYNDGLITFTNGISIYRLRQELEITEKMKEAQRIDSNGIHFLRETEIKEVDTMLDRCRMLLGDNKLSVEFFSRSFENQITNYESGPVQHSFNMKQIDYMDAFLGKDAETYISDKNPIAYAESDKGIGYVLGIRR